MARLAVSANLTDTVLRRIQDSGGRVTVSTRLVVSILSQTDQHLTADDLIADLDRRAPGIAPSTVYRVLQRLDELELLEHVRTGAGAAFYHLRQHSHAHLVCSDCGGVTDVSGPAGDALLHFGTAVRASFGFSIDPDHSALLGRCRECSTRDVPRSVNETVSDSPAGDELTAAHQR
jgi:Fur family transcriptional regulator, ferric uptake regulator